MRGDGCVSVSGESKQPWWVRVPPSSATLSAHLEDLGGGFVQGSLYASNYKMSMFPGAQKMVSSLQLCVFGRA